MWLRNRTEVPSPVVFVKRSVGAEGKNTRNFACRAAINPVSPILPSRTTNLNLSPRKTLEEGPEPRKPTRAADLGPGSSAFTRFWRCVTGAQHRLSAPVLKRSRLFQFCFHITFRYNQNFWTNPFKVLRMSAIAGLRARVVWREDLGFRGAGTKYKVLRELRSGQSWRHPGTVGTRTLSHRAGGVGS